MRSWLAISLNVSGQHFWKRMWLYVPTKSANMLNRFFHSAFYPSGILKENFIYFLKKFSLLLKWNPETELYFRHSAMNLEFLFPFWIWFEPARYFEDGHLWSSFLLSLTFLFWWTGHISRTKLREWMNNICHFSAVFFEIPQNEFHKCSRKIVFEFENDIFIDK